MTPQTTLRRQRPRTATNPPTAPSIPWSHHQGSSCGLNLDVDASLCDEQEQTLVEVFNKECVLEEKDHTVPPPPRRRGAAKSFSHLRHPVGGLRALGRRLSVSIRHKSSSKHAAHEEGTTGHRRNVSGNGGDSHSPWCREPSINRRPSLNSVSALHSFYAPTTLITAPIPGRGLEQPPILPNSLSAGAAARAAAAAQNELARAERHAAKVAEQRVALDSESGIGIDLRDRSELSGLPSMSRCDPVAYLPSEVMAQVLAYLDPDSLMRAELVSSAWRDQASSHHVWRHVFRQAHGRHRASATATKKKQSSGLGKTMPNQDWKKMFLVRRALEYRWKEGKAAAIYLNGHQDSVYCAQFDEDKIITGSRDRTIRVWDAHYPWACRKIIGPSPGNSSSAGPMNNPAQQSTGKAPFLTISPPSSAPDEAEPFELPGAENYHSASILCLQFDDEILVTGSSDYTCIVYDVRNDYRPIRRLQGHRAGVLDVCFDDRYIVSCSKDSTICVWDRQTGALVKKLLGHEGPVNAVQLRGDLIVSASGDGVAKLWNITSGTCVKEFPSKDRGLACIEFSEDARTILTGGNDKVIYQFDANTGDLVQELEGHEGLVRSLHLDSLNGRIVSGSYDMSVKVFDVNTGALSINLPGWTTSWMLSVKSDYRRIVATSQDSRAVIMDFGYGLDGIELLEEW